MQTDKKSYPEKRSPTDSNDVNSKTSKKSKSKRSSSKSSGSDKCAVLRLIGNRSVYHVSVDDFMKVSHLIKKQHHLGDLMTSVDLSRFSDQSILAFVNYIQNGEIKTALTYYALTELITLAKTFLMKDLKISLEDALVEASKNSEADLLQALIICDATHVSPEAEHQLQLAAIESIDKMVCLPDFHRLPYNQLIQLLSSCELTVTHEMYIADVILLWLSGQRNITAYAPGLFLCIRTKFLSPVDKTLIIERINILNMPDKVVRLVRNVLESVNSQRVCTDPNHAKKTFTRCGQSANLTSFGTHSALPLSRPNFKIKMKKTKESKSKPTFDPKENPKVIDIIQNNNGVALSKKKSRKRSAKKRKCACIDFIKNKLNKNKKKAAEQRASSASKKSAISLKSESKSVSKSVTKSKSKSNLAVDRRNEKRQKIKKAMKDESDKSKSKSKSMSASKSKK